MKTIYFGILFVLSSFFANSQVVIFEIYGDGGNTGASYKNDYIVLYNPTTAAVSLSGWSFQYAASTSSSWAVTNLSGSIASKGFYLIQLFAGAAGSGSSLPTPNVTGTTNMGATTGKVALVSTTTALAVSCPTGASIIDFVGYGTTANCSETAPTANIANDKAARRTSGNDTGNNSVDFAIVTPNPQNAASPLPVYLSSFKVEAIKTEVKLAWQTAEEINNSHFVIERSHDALYFEAIGQVEGYKNSIETLSYVFVDETPHNGVNYYRLKQVDFDGTYEYSKTISTNFIGETSFRSYPNPVKSKLTIDIPSDVNIMNVDIINMLGEVVLRFNATNELSLHSLNEGVYLLKVQTIEGRVFSQRIIKTNY